MNREDNCKAECKIPNDITLDLPINIMNSNIQYIKEDIIKMTVKGITQPITWTKLVEYYNNNVINVDDMRNIVQYRRQVVNKILDKLFECNCAKIQNIELYKDDKLLDIRPQLSCYTESGTPNLLSDLDFTYASFNERSIKIPEYLNAFYTMFEYNFGNPPDVVFDSNFYVCNTWLNTLECVNTKLRWMFKEYRNENNETVYRLYYKTDLDEYDKYVNEDNDFCYGIIKQKHKKGFTPNNQLMREYVKTFYIKINYLINNPNNNSNIIILKLRKLIYQIMLHSNETYLHDATIGVIVMNIRLERQNLKECCYAYIDNYLYILEKIEEYGDNKIKLFDRISKYMKRCFEIYSKTILRLLYKKTNTQGRILDISSNKIKPDSYSDLLSPVNHTDVNTFYKNIIIPYLKDYRNNKPLKEGVKIYNDINNLLDKILKDFNTIFDACMYLVDPVDILSGGYKQKYLKYKRKYLQLKNH